ncbi:MAG: PAS domain S-box protein [SAR324 cluster bacterium]|nr:PAS domain S-box protein [SAR324 cluster bacterium]
MTPRYSFLVIVGTTFLAEALVMIMFRFWPPAPWMEVFIDACILSIVMWGCLHYFLIRPLDNHLIHYKNLVEQLSKRDALARSLDYTGDGLMITDLNEIIIYANPSLESMTGYSAQELLGKTSRMLNSDRQNTEIYQDLLKTVSGGQCWRNETISQRKNGSRFYADVTVSPVFNQSGDITHFSTIMRDVTEKHEMEARLLAAQKLEVIGILSAGVAHNFNNLLNIIAGAIAIMSEEPNHSERDVKMLDLVQKTVTRGSRLVKQIMVLGGTTKNLMVINLSEYLRQEADRLSMIIPKSVQLKVNIQTENIFIKMDSGQISEILLNLCLNAVHAMDTTGGTLEIILQGMPQTSQDFGDNDPAWKYGQLQCARLSLSDTGCGIPPETLNRIFEPFFTTKETGNGSGLGLSVVQGLIEANKGQISVSSEVGKGTTFDLYFPTTSELPLKNMERSEDMVRSPILTAIQAQSLFENKTVAPSDVLSMESSHQSPETVLGIEQIHPEKRYVLIAEDEPVLIEIYKAMLKKKGVPVIVCGDGEKAFQTWKDNPEKFSLVITDYAMPNMNGAQLAINLHQHAPDLPILMVTGYGDAFSQKELDAWGIRECLSKPVNFKMLIDLIRQYQEQ